MFSLTWVFQFFSNMGEGEGEGGHHQKAYPPY